MVNPYQLIFSTVYLWGLRRNGDQDGPEYSAALGMSLVLLINLASIAHILYGLGLHEIRLLDVPKGVILAAGALIAVLHFYWFVRGERYRSIADRVESGEGLESKGELITLLYAACSVGLLLVAWSY